MQFIAVQLSNRAVGQSPKEGVMGPSASIDTWVRDGEGGVRGGGEGRRGERG